MRFVTVVLALAMTALCGSSAAVVADDASASVPVDGVERTYLVHVPPALRPNAPLVIAFHGHGGEGAGMARLTDFDAYADRGGFIVVYPDGIDRGWNDGRSVDRAVDTDDIGFVRVLIDTLSTRYALDRSRVYATGMSNGAIFTERLGCELADRFAAIAAVAGTIPVDPGKPCRPARSLPVLQIHGTVDPIVPYDGGSVGIVGGRGDVVSVDETVAFWAKNDGCRTASRPVTLPAKDPADGTHVDRSERGDCRGGATVVLDSVIGGGHAWPGHGRRNPLNAVGTSSTQLDASQAILEFFGRHGLR